MIEWCHLADCVRHHKVPIIKDTEGAGLHSMHVMDNRHSINPHNKHKHHHSHPNHMLYGSFADHVLCGNFPSSFNKLLFNHRCDMTLYRGNYSNRLSALVTGHRVPDQQQAVFPDRAGVFCSAPLLHSALTHAVYLIKDDIVQPGNPVSVGR